MAISETKFGVTSDFDDSDVVLRQDNSLNDKNSVENLIDTFNKSSKFT